ncbi:MAG: M42 family peptidase [Clostridiales bacterium]|nr:M42 family peptidase [Clostridiales bacterium]
MSRLNELKLYDTALPELSNIRGVSGDEGAVRKRIKELASPFCSEIFTDTMGNLYAHKKKEGRPRVALTAHMDEVGFLVTKIRDDGEIEYAPAGVDCRVMPGRRLAIGKDKVMGVVGTKPIHLQSDEDFEASVPHKRLTIDVGAKDRADAEKYVHIGDYACFTTEFSEFGEGLFSGKALDDRVGCTVLLELMKEEYDLDMYFCFTVQEEAGIRGANLVADHVKPDLVLNFEGTTANDMPDLKGHEVVTEVGKGPAITFMDRTTVVRPGLFDALRGAAKNAGIPYQLRRGTNGATDIGRIHTDLGGCLAGGISLPCRYIHSALGVASWEDLKNMMLLADAFLKNTDINEVTKFENR